MADGFEVYADNGTLLVNNNMICWFCARTGRGATQSGVGLGNTTASKAVIDTSGLTYPLSAIRMDGDHAAARANNDWTNGAHQYGTSAPEGTGFSWYVFDYAPRLPAVNSGIEMYRDDGQRSFNSAYFPFKPVASLGSISTPGKVLAVSGPNMSGYARPAGAITYYNQAPGGISLPMPEDGTNGEGATHYAYQNDSKLYGGRVIGNDYAEGALVSFDDVYFGPHPMPLIVALWDIGSPALAVDVSNIPVGATFF